MSETMLTTITPAEAEQYLNSFKSKLGCRALTSNTSETESQLKTRQTLLEGIQSGLIEFDEEVKGITQKLLYPFTYNGMEVTELCFFKRLKLKDIKNLRDGEEAKVLIHNLAVMTNETDAKLEELDLTDLEYSSAIYAFLQQKW